MKKSRWILCLCALLLAAVLLCACVDGGQTGDNASQGSANRQQSEGPEGIPTPWDSGDDQTPGGNLLEPDFDI